MISCIILAGGTSKNMFEKKKVKPNTKAKNAKTKKNVKISEIKAFIPLCDRPMVLHVVNIAKKFFPEIVIVVNTKKQKLEMEQIIHNSRVIVVVNKSKTLSPVAQIKTGIEYATGDNVFVLGCDMPFVTGVTIFQLINKMKKGINCIIPSKANGEGKRKYEPMCAIYSKRVFAKATADQNLKNIIERCRKICIPIYDESIFFNIDTREDLEKAEIIMRTKGKKKK